MIFNNKNTFDNLWRTEELTPTQFRRPTKNIPNEFVHFSDSNSNGKWSESFIVFGVEFRGVNMSEREKEMAEQKGQIKCDIRNNLFENSVKEKW